MTLAALSLALALCFTGGLLAMLGQIASSALMMAYALIGFAVLHTLTLAMKSRALWLSAPTPSCWYSAGRLVAMVGLGLADAVFGFRQRLSAPEDAAACSFVLSFTPSTPTTPAQHKETTTMEVILLERVAKPRPDGRGRPRQGRVCP